MASFMEIVERARALLQRNGRVSLRALKREYAVDDDALGELVEELSQVQQVARRDGNVLVWVGRHATAATTAGAAPAQPATDSPGSPSPGAESAESAESDPAPVSVQTSAHTSAPTGERRQLTVLFCNLVDSARLSSSLDPEDWREVVRGYQRAAGLVIARFDGHVAQYMGDGILAYFGYPVAHEDDAERAARAGLGILQAMSEANESLPPAAREITLRVRVGVHTGPVVLGSMGDDSGQIQALGDTTNLAARLQDQARPDTVVISPQSRRLVQGVFVTHDRGERELKGIAQPVQIIEVERVSGVRSRLDVLAAADLTPLVGREQELGLFEERFGEVCDGFGQAILVSGEAGIGKSRLILAFREQLQDRPHSWLECRCSPYTQDSAFHPILDLTRQALGFRPDDPAADQAAALEAGLEAWGFDLATSLPLLAGMHGLPLPDGYPPLTLASEGKRKKTLALLVEWVLRLAQSQPLMLLVEDLHWVDPSTLEWLGGMLDQIPRSQVLLLLTYRPDFEPPWAPKSHLTPMQLSRMTRAQLADLVRKSARDRVLPEEWLEQIIHRSDGVPLFAEELTRTVLETNPEVPAGEEVPTLHIPETLQNSLMARLDALGPAKELAQLGAVLGREFDYELLLQVSSLREEELRGALEVAVREELFYQRGTPPAASYLFKHALICDAAYQSLLRGQRQRYHLQIAETMQDGSPVTLEQHPERVAHHFAEAGEAERAIPLLQAAARLAAARSAHTETEAHLRRAIALLPAATSDGPSRELELYDSLAATALATHGHGSDEFRRIAIHLDALMDASPDHPTALQALGKMCNFYRDRGELDAACTRARRMCEAGERLPDDDLLGGGRAGLALIDGLRGRFSEAIALQHQLGHFDRDREIRRVAKAGQSSFLAGGCWTSWWLFCQGYPVQAIELSEETIRCTRLIEHPLTLAMDLTFVGYVRLFTREYAQCALLCEEAGSIASENGFLLWGGLSALCAAAARTGLGEPQGSELFASIRASGQTGLRGGIPAVLWSGALIQRASGQPDAALETIDFALETFTPVGQIFWHAEFHRLRGEIRADERCDPAAAEESFRAALEFARNQDAVGLELRAATSYARLLRDEGRTKEAHSLLAPVFDGLCEGRELPDGVDARTLLDELRV